MHLFSSTRCEWLTCKIVDNMFLYAMYKIRQIFHLRLFFCFFLCEKSALVQEMNWRRLGANPFLDQLWQRYWPLISGQWVKIQSLIYSQSYLLIMKMCSNQILVINNVDVWVYSRSCDPLNSGILFTIGGVTGNTPQPPLLSE